MLRGSCLCKGVRYEISGPLHSVRNCHCSMCRKVTGAAHETLGLALGTLDDDPGVRPQCHVFVGSKAPWHEITDDLPQFDQGPGDGY